VCQQSVAGKKHNLFLASTTMSYQGETKENTTSRTTSNDDDNSNCHTKLLNHASMSISDLRQHHLPALNNQLEYLKISICLEATKDNFGEVHRLSKEAMEIQIEKERLEAMIQEIVSKDAKKCKDFKITSEQLPEEMLLVIFSFLFSLESSKYLSFENRKNFNHVRWCCQRFKDDLPPLPVGMWTTFPHPNYSSLKRLVKALKNLEIVPPLALFLANGVHVIEDEYIEDWGRELNMLNINLPISIFGESREHCIVMGGLKMNGKKEDDVNGSNLTLRDSGDHGVWGWGGASVHLDNVSVENSEGIGVFVYGTKRSTMKNCNVSHSKGSGLTVNGGGLMTIDGNGTTIHHNCTNGGSWNYGLYTDSSSSSIHLASSLTIETISKNNGGGGSYGGAGTIAIVDNEGTIVETIQEASQDSDEDDDEDD